MIKQLVQEQPTPGEYVNRGERGERNVVADWRDIADKIYRGRSVGERGREGYRRTVAEEEEGRKGGTS